MRGFEALIPDRLRSPDGQTVVLKTERLGAAALYFSVAYVAVVSDSQTLWFTREEFKKALALVEVLLGEVLGVGER